MTTWIELEGRFRELEPALRYTRLDHQTGGAGEYFRLAGGSDQYALSRFETLAEMAGDKLTSDGIAAKYPDLAAEHQSRIMWYRAVRTLTDLSRPALHGWTGTDDNMQPLAITSVDRVAEASALVCLKLSQTEVAPADALSRLDAPADEILELRPNLWGVGVNLRAAWRRFTAWLRPGG